MKIYDLSVNIYSNMLKWPSDPEIEIRPFLSIKNGAPANLSILNMGSHTGTHIDAPYHFNLNGKTVDKLSLYDLIGEAIVVEIKSDVISVNELKNIDLKKYKRILFKTKNSMFQTNKFNPDYTYLDFPAAKELLKNNVKLVGIDYLSIEKFDSKTHNVHKILTQNNIIILETLNLSKINPGEYFLVALPLKIKNCDGAPARVVLIKF